ncbi:MAG: glycosyltransferase family 2 protein [Lachnospiraceae bacterium]|nr:glycosyltransferase family 2 protein [Lachnospiraceae bacterium]
MEEKKVSIISIVYQVEPYIRQCLDSLLAQTYQNLQLILVVGVKENGDGDNACLSICREYADRDSRITLVASPARGIADARNVGLAHVQGDLIGFVDGDDWVDEDYVTSLVTQLEKTGSDIAVCGRYYEFQNRTGADAASDTTVLTPQEAMRTIINGTGFFLHLWDKLFQRSLWDHVVFPTDHVVEDRIIVNRIIGDAGSISYNSTPKYHFRERSGSNSKKPGMAWHNAEANRMLCMYVTEHFPALKNETGRFYLQEILTSLQNLLVTKEHSRDEKDTFTREIRKIAKDNRNNPLIDRKLKIKTALALYAPMILKQVTKHHQTRDMGENRRYE